MLESLAPCDDFSELSRRFCAVALSPPLFFPSFSLAQEKIVSAITCIGPEIWRAAHFRPWRFEPVEAILRKNQREK